MSARSTMMNYSSSRGSASREKEIRSRLLNKLGIFDSSSTPQQPTTAAQNRRLRILRGMGVGYPMLRPTPPDGSASRPPLGGAVPFEEPLKYNVNKDDAPSRSKQQHVEKSTRIAFDDTVSVIPIPKRTEYSDRIKSRIWSNRHELHENAQRNAVEFAAEGWNWRNVTEDEGMYICSATGDLVHPVHCEHLATE